MKRLNDGFALLLVWILTALSLDADTRILKSKVSGEIASPTTSTNGDPFVVVKLDTPLIQQEFGDGAKLVAELGDQSTDTNLVVNVVDKAGDVLGTLFDCDVVTRVDVRTSPPRVRFFATGEGFDSVTHPVIGTVTFSDVSISGTIEFTTNGLPRRVKAAIHARGDADDGEIVFTGKLSSNDPFVPHP